MEGTPGWYGKLPSTGDFASRRLPHELIEPWDNWLAEELAGLKAQSDDWLSAYLDSPTWRFVVPARWVHAGQAGLLAGVLMPSVDSVGRYFPLSIMAALPEVPAHAPALEPILNWLHALDDLAADALQEDWPIDTLEAALARLPVPRPDPLAVSDMSLLLAGDRRMVSVPVPDTRQALMGGVGQALLQWVLGASSGQAPDLGWWWCEPHAMVQQRQLLVSTGLPCGPDFATLLGSNHNRHAVPVTSQPPATAAAAMSMAGVSGVAFLSPDALNAAASDETVPPLSITAVSRPPVVADDGDATLPPAPRATPQAPDPAPDPAPAHQGVTADDTLAPAPDTGDTSAEPDPDDTVGNDASVHAPAVDDASAQASTETSTEAPTDVPQDTEASATGEDAGEPSADSVPDPDPDQTLPHTDGVS